MHRRRQDFQGEYLNIGSKYSGEAPKRKLKELYTEADRSYKRAKNLTARNLPQRGLLKYKAQ